MRYEAIHEQPVSERCRASCHDRPTFSIMRAGQAGRGERLLRVALAENPGDTYFITSSSGISKEVHARYGTLPTSIQGLVRGDERATA